MKNVSLKLSESLYAELARLAKQRGAAKSDVIREALEAYFVGTTNGGRASCAELAGDLVGSVSGPTDLSTNPKHLRGYGR